MALNILWPTTRGCHPPPPGTEPVLRVYTEGRSTEMVKALMAYGHKVAESVVCSLAFGIYSTLYSEDTCWRLIIESRFQRELGAGTK